MLLDKSVEQILAGIYDRIASSFSVFLLGRDLGQNLFQASSSALGLTVQSKWTVLETAYIAGKAATQIGSERLKKMSEKQLQTWLTKNPIELSQNDQAQLKALRGDTHRWMEGRSNTWKDRLRTQLVRADREFRAVMAVGDANNAKALAISRNSALNELILRLRDGSDAMLSDVDRLVQSEMNNYFQVGQVADEDGEQYVYKIPRLSACRYCMELHVDDEGMPIFYKLSEVMGNSNIGMPASEWVFTIGPVHPYCYCVLQFVDADNLPQASQAYKDAMEDLNKSIRQENHCGVKEVDTTMFDDLLSIPPTHNFPPERERLIKALTAMQKNED